MNVQQKKRPVKFRQRGKQRKRDMFSHFRTKTDQDRKKYNKYKDRVKKESREAQKKCWKNLGKGTTVILLLLLFSDLSPSVLDIVIFHFSRCFASLLQRPPARVLTSPSYPLGGRSTFLFPILCCQFNGRFVHHSK